MERADASRQRLFGLSSPFQSAAGWAPDTTDSKTYGSTKVCSYTGPDAMKQSVVLVVARPAPMRQEKSKMASTPIEGLGMPAVRTEVEGAATPTSRSSGGIVPGDLLAAKAAGRLQ